MLRSMLSWREARVLELDDRNGKARFITSEMEALEWALQIASEQDA